MRIAGRLFLCLGLGTLGPAAFATSLLAAGSGDGFAAFRINDAFDSLAAADFPAGSAGVFWISSDWTSGATAEDGTVGTHGGANGLISNYAGTIVGVTGISNSSNQIFDLGVVPYGTPIPEPATSGLVGLSLLGLNFLRRRCKRTNAAHRPVLVQRRTPC